MKNSDRLVCLFESEGMDIRDIFEAKQKEVFHNRSRTDFVASLNGEVKNDVLRLKGTNYYELCLIDDIIKNKKNVADDVVRNPFIYNYQNIILSDRRINSCVSVVEGELYSLDYIRDSKTSKTAKTDIVNSIKAQWAKETSDYVTSRKIDQIRYMQSQQTAYQAPNGCSSHNLRIKAILLIILVVMSFIGAGISDWIRDNIMKGDIIRGVSVMATLMAVNLAIGFFLVRMEYKRQIVIVNKKYNRLLDEMHIITDYPIKMLFSNMRLQGIFNFRKKCDDIDHLYNGGSRSHHGSLFNLLSKVYYLETIAMLVCGFVLVNPLVVIISLIILNLSKDQSKSEVSLNV